MIEEVPLRLAPTKKTLRELFSKSGNQCACHGCLALMINKSGDFIGQVCHIEAAFPGGERFNPNQTNEDRRSYKNLILLCYQHHIETNDRINYPVKTLKRIKKDHENKVERLFNISEDNLDKVYDNLKPVIETQVKILETSMRIEAKIDQIGLFTRGTSTDIHSINDLDRFENDIQIAVNQRKVGNPYIAITLLSNLKEQHWDVLNQVSKYLVLAETGIAQLDLNQDKDAAINFIKAVEFNSENAKAIGLAAIGYLLLDQKKNAKLRIDQAIRIDPTATNAYLALIQLMIEDCKPTEIIDTIPNDQLENPEIATAIAEAYNISGDYTNAIIWFEKALKQNPFNLAQTKEALALAILESCKGNVRPFSGSYSENLLSKINYVIGLLNDAWNSIKDTELRKIKVHWLFNRGIAYRFINELDASYSDIKYAISIDDSKPEFHIQFAIASYLLEKYEQALQITNSIGQDVGSFKDFNLNLLKASICFKLEKFKETIQFASLEISTDIKTNQFNIAIGLIVDSYLAIQALDEAIAFVMDLMIKFDKNSRIFLEGSKVYAQSGDIIKREELLMLAVKSISDDTNIIDIFELAKALIINNMDKEAILLLERIVDDTVYSPMSFNLIQVLYRAGEYGRALSICEKLNIKYGPIEVISDIHSSIYESIDVPNKAIEICESHLRSFPDDQWILLRLIVLQDKYFMSIEVGKNIKTLKVSAEWDHNVLMRIASLFIKYDRITEGLELAYTVRKNNFNVSEVHQLYVSFIAGALVSNIDFTTDDFVQLNSTVTIEGSNGIIMTYTLVNSVECSIPNELPINDKLAICFLGKKKGDQVFFQREFGPNLEIQIKSIQNKYLFAWNDSMDQLQTRFFEGHSFRKFKMGETGDPMKDIRPLFDLIDQTSKSEEGVNNLYKQNKLTIGALALLKNINPCKTWAGLVSDPQLGVFCRGLSRITVFPNVNLSNPLPLIIDITFLLSCSTLQMLDSKALQTRRKLVSQSSRWLLMEMIAEMTKAEHSGIKTIGKNGQNYIRQEISAEQVGNIRTHYIKLNQWISDNCEILSSSLSLEMNFKEKEEIDNVLGKAFFDSILLAKENNGILLSDDEFLRIIAFTVHQVKSISIFDWLAFQRSSQLLDQNTFNSAIIELIRLGYRYLPVNDTILFECAKISGFSYKHPFSLALTTLSGKRSDPGPAVKYAVKFLMILYSDAQIAIVRFNITLMVLNELFLNRDIKNTHILFCNEVVKTFHLLQLQMDQVLELEGAFYKLRS